MASAFLQALASARPELAAACGELAALHEAKLWHELTLKLEEVVVAPAFCAPGDDVLVRLYTSFVADFEDKVNQLKLVALAVAVSARLPDPPSAVAFLSAAAAKLEGSGAEGELPRLYLRANEALLRLQAWRLAGRDDDLAAAKKGADECRAALDALPGLATGASVAAAVHLLCAQLAKARQEYASFYKEGHLYLAHVQLDTLPEATQQARTGRLASPCLRRSPLARSRSPVLSHAHRSWRWTCPWPRCWATRSTASASC